MEFRFAVAENELPPPSGFDLGHIDVHGSENDATSRGRTPDQSMMIYLSLTLLLDGLRRFLTGRKPAYESAAVDSSFSLTFTRVGGDQIDVSYRGVVLERSTARELADAVFESAQSFARMSLPALPPDDAGREDLESSLGEFARFLEREQRWSAQTDRVLSEAGWYPGRAVSTVRWENALRERGGFEIHEAARGFLREFGGLVSAERGPGKTMARMGFRLDPAVAEWEDEIFEALSEEAGVALYPIGEADRGNQYLAMAPNGAVYVGMDSVTLLARTADEALEKLAEGVR